MDKLVTKKFPHQKNNQRGSTLPYLLGMVVCLGIMISVLFKSVEGNNKLVGKTSKKIQAEMIAQSGLSFALNKIQQDKFPWGLNYQTENLTHWLETNKLGFHLSVWPYGLNSKVFVQGVRLGADSTVKYVIGEVGQTLSINSFPTLALTNKQGDMVLAGNSSISGNVLLWRGGVRKKNFGKIRFSGKSGHAGNVYDSSSSYWKKLPIDLEKVSSWIEKQNEILTSGQFSSDPYAKAYPWFTREVKGNLNLHDTIVDGGIFSIRGKAVLGPNVQLIHSKLLADEIVVNGSTVDNSILYAKKKMSIKGNVNLSGQFLAGDSLIIDIKSELKEFPMFYVQGRLFSSAEEDSLYVGGMDLKQVSGEGVFIFGGVDRPRTHQKEHITIAKGSNLKGMVYARGWVNMSGSLKGSLICENLKFKYKGTIYSGHLYNSRLSGFSSGDVSEIQVPLIFTQHLFPQVVNKEWL